MIEVVCLSALRKKVTLMSFNLGIATFNRGQHLAATLASVH